MKYLGKIKVYEMATEMLQYQDMPKCKECSYLFFNGYEWLIFRLPNCEVRFTVLNQGEWVKVVEWDGDREVYRNDVLKSIDPRLAWNYISQMREPVEGGSHNYPLTWNHQEPIECR